VITRRSGHIRTGGSKSSHRSNSRPRWNCVPACRRWNGGAVRRESSELAVRLAAPATNRPCAGLGRAGARFSWCRWCRAARMWIGERGRYGDDNGGGCPAGRFLIASGMRVWIATTGRRGVHHQVHTGLVVRMPKSQVARRRPFWAVPALLIRNLASRLDSPQASRHSFPMLDSRILRRSRSVVQLN